MLYLMQYLVNCCVHSEPQLQQQTNNLSLCHHQHVTHLKHIKQVCKPWTFSDCYNNWVNYGHSCLQLIYLFEGSNTHRQTSYSSPIAFQHQDIVKHGFFFILMQTFLRFETKKLPRDQRPIRYLEHTSLNYAQIVISMS